jgi:sugar/nucleoside kinase (ribokinase family)
MADVLCAGVLVADIFGSPVEAVPAAGELASIDRYLLSVGGCAANTAAALKRLGRTASVSGKVGDDLFGDFVLRDLQRLGAETTYVKKSKSFPTSCTFILNVRGQDRRYIHCFGANADYSLADIDLAALEGARALYVGGYLVMPAFRPEQLVELFRQAKERGLITILDVAVPATSRATLEDIRPALPYTDAFLPNTDEARALTGRSDPRDQAEVFSQFNRNCTVVITQGKAGALARKGNLVLRAGSYRVNSVDESGGGDAFDAGFIIGLLEDWSLEDTLRFASAVGASCTRAMGCHEGVFYLDEAKEFIRQNHLEVTRLS